MLKTPNLSIENESKIYDSINNLIKAKDFKIDKSWKIPNHAEKNLNSYLRLVNSMVEKNPG